MPQIAASEPGSSHDIFAAGDATQVALALARWDRAAAPPVLRALITDCQTKAQFWRKQPVDASSLVRNVSDFAFRRYKVVDPSFHNWAGLALALRGQEISDFPLCNKSFNLSYAGFDL